MDEEERLKVLEKLQQDEEEFFANLKPSKYQDGWKEETWEKEMEEHPLFATKLPDNADLPPLVEAMQQLKYDAELNGPEDLAEQYKADGNNNFKLKKYRWAVISYTEGLRQKCKNLELNAQLYCNRAAAHFRIKNYGSALADSAAASKLKPNYTKAMTKAALCCWELERYQECVDWCKQLLELDPANTEMKVLKEKAEKALKLDERNRRKAELKAKQEAQREAALRSALLERGIELPKAKDEELECNSFEALMPTHPALQGHRVHLSPTGDGLVWPAIFLYPEVMESDFVQSFDESSTFGEQLELLFGDPNSQPEWNASGRYTPNHVSVWFKDHFTGKPVAISPATTLRTVVFNKRFHIDNGTASFWILPKGTEYEAHFLADTGSR
nr:DNA polymerase interacting tetratricopeptide repeat-containing, protein of 47 kDa-like isoform X1 [Dermacentor andersoni]